MAVTEVVERALSLSSFNLQGSQQIRMRAFHRNKSVEASQIALTQDCVTPSGASEVVGLQDQTTPTTKEVRSPSNLHQSVLPEGAKLRRVQAGGSGAAPRQQAQLTCQVGEGAGGVGVGNGCRVVVLGWDHSATPVLTTHTAN